MSAKTAKELKILREHIAEHKVQLHNLLLKSEDLQAEVERITCAREAVEEDQKRRKRPG